MPPTTDATNGDVPRTPTPDMTPAQPVPPETPTSGDSTSPPAPVAPAADVVRTPADATTTPDRPAPAAAPQLPDIGALVRYDSVDQVTQNALTGLGVVVDAFTTGAGDHQVHRVALAQLPANLFLDAADVEPL